MYIFFHLIVLFFMARQFFAIKRSYWYWCKRVVADLIQMQMKLPQSERNTKQYLWHISIYPPIKNIQTLDHCKEYGLIIWYVSIDHIALTILKTFPFYVCNKILWSHCIIRL